MTSPITPAPSQQALSLRNGGEADCEVTHEPATAKACLLDGEGRGMLKELGMAAADNNHTALVEALEAFYARNYVQSADARQKAMGLRYTTVETHDLAKHTANFLATFQSWSGAKVMDGWQPISSAPRDGTEFLLLDRIEGVWAVEWSETYRAFVTLHPSDGESPAQPWEPTHWMPLPAPPQQAASAAASYYTATPKVLP